MNFFACKSAAERYAQARPFFHPFVIARIKEFLALTEPLACALDVGCGTGMSALALREIARQVVGLDAATEMLAHAPRDAGISYAVAVAEALPFGAHKFDLLTLSQVSHWLDRRAFFAAARRVLRPAGWLVIYDAYFSARTVESTDFQSWHREIYLQRFPSPPRAPVVLLASDAKDSGIQLLTEERLQHTIRFTVEQVVEYLLTQSNVIAAVESGTEQIDAARRWLTDNIQPLFEGRVEITFLFDIPVWYLQVEDMAR